VVLGDDFSAYFPSSPQDIGVFIFPSCII